MKNKRKSLLINRYKSNQVDKKINYNNLKNVTLDKILGNNFEVIDYNKSTNKEFEIFNILESENEGKSIINSFKNLVLPKIKFKNISANKKNKKLWNLNKIYINDYIKFSKYYTKTENTNIINKKYKIKTYRVKNNNSFNKYENKKKIEIKKISPIIKIGLRKLSNNKKKLKIFKKPLHN